ncbi:hypothetical protein ABZ330_16655 [Streptomyces sp. NPDC006172]|uniref:hypothetical protein n=1 Tax=Streptomyces sp. NPDC006172 TaxID=3154470 RepID=UPI0033D8BB18
MKDVTQKIRELLALTREVDEWREEHDPGTQEWHTLCDLSDKAASLIFSLPTELLPDEEIRSGVPTPEPAPAWSPDDPAPTVDELIELLGL